MNRIFRHLGLALLLMFLASGLSIASDEEKMKAVAANCEANARGKDDPQAYYRTCIEMNTVAINMVDEEADSDDND